MNRNGFFRACNTKVIKGLKIVHSKIRAGKNKNWYIAQRLRLHAVAVFNAHLPATDVDL
jgi:hypothetical protein